MNAVPTASRPSAPEVPPVEHQGVRYEQDRHDDSAGDQPGGYLAATHIQSGARLWRIKVYAVPAAAPGRPAMARYFRSMRLAPEGQALLIENEAGGVYRVDLATHVSTQVSGPPETAAPAATAKPRPMPE